MNKWIIKWYWIIAGFYFAFLSSFATNSISISISISLFVPFYSCCSYSYSLTLQLLLDFAVVLNDWCWSTIICNSDDIGFGCIIHWCCFCLYIVYFCFILFFALLLLLLLLVVYRKRSYFLFFKRLFVSFNQKHYALTISPCQFPKADALLVDY